MHPKQIAVRRSIAHERIKNATLVLGESSGVEAPDFASIPGMGGPEVVSLKEAEMLADYLEALRDSQKRPGRRRQQSTEANGGPAQGDQAQGESGQTAPEASVETAQTGDADTDATFTLGVDPANEQGGGTGGVVPSELPPPIVDPLEVAHASA